MNKIEVAQTVVDRRYADYLLACQKLATLVKDEESKAKAKIDAIQQAAQQKMAAVQLSFETLRTPAVQKVLAVTVDSERIALGLSPRYSK